VAVCICLGIEAPALAATPTPDLGTTAPGTKLGTTKPAGKCLIDLRSFPTNMQKDRYWLGGSGYGYGYPMMGGYCLDDARPIGAGALAAEPGYRDARAGYDVRTLIAAANILA
jgi:hypothetical protein